MSDGTATLPEREVRERRAPEERPAKKSIIIGTMVSGLLGLVAGVLAIIGLANVYPFWMVTLATIALGVCFLFEGMTLVGRVSPLLHEATEERGQMAELGPGTTGVMLAGLIGIVLGILGLLNVRPIVLIPSAAILFGAALVIGAGANIRINDILMNRQERLGAGQSVLATIGLRGLTGLGAMILGILALVTTTPMTLSLVATFLTSVTLLLTDAAIAGRILSVFRR